MDNILFVHGVSPDSIDSYLTRLSDDELQEIFDNLEQQIAFIGHSHDPLSWYYDGTIRNFKMLRQGITQMDSKVKNIVNVGSVSMPNSFNGKSVFSKLLCVHYIFEGAEDSIAWAIKNPEKWQESIEALMLSDR